MNSFRAMFGFNTQLIHYLRQNPLNEIYPANQDEGAIFLGNIYAAYSLEILRKHNITAVLTVAAGTNLKYSPENGIKHLVILADDIESFNLGRHFERIVDFIAQCRLEKRNILVHCFAGISRSTTSIVAYMIREKNEGYRKVINYIRARRKEINPNAGFMRQLANYEKKIKAQNAEKKNQSSVQCPPINGTQSALQNATSRSKSWNNQNQLGLSVKQSPFSNTNLESQTLNKNGRIIVMNGKRGNLNNQADETTNKTIKEEEEENYKEKKQENGKTSNNFHYNNNNVVKQPYFQKSLKQQDPVLDGNKNKLQQKKQDLMGKQFHGIQEKLNKQQQQQNLNQQQQYQFKGTLFKSNNNNNRNFNNNYSLNNQIPQINQPLKINQKIAAPKIQTIGQNKMPSPLKIQKINNNNNYNYNGNQNQNQNRNFHYTSGIKGKNNFRGAYVNGNV